MLISFIRVVPEKHVFNKDVMQASMSLCSIFFAFAVKNKLFSLALNTVNTKMLIQVHKAGCMSNLVSKYLVKLLKEFKKNDVDYSSAYYNLNAIWRLDHYYHNLVFGNRVLSIKANKWIIQLTQGFFNA